MKGQRKSKSNTNDGRNGSDKMGITDKIEAFILELMKQENDEWLTIQRNELADIFGCVPSQINYVISTRFSPERGYTVISRRGGGGCVKIKHTEPSGGVTETEAVNEIKRMVSGGIINEREAALMKAAVTDEVLRTAENSGTLRTSILNDMKAVFGSGAH